MKAFIKAMTTMNLLQIHRISKDMQTVIRMYFLYVAIESGLLNALKRPKTRDELLAILEVSRSDILDALLDVGCALNELTYRQGQYVLVGKRAKALVAPDGDALMAIVQAIGSYYHSIYYLAAERLRGAPIGDYLPTIGGIVARIGKITEPFVHAFVQNLVANKGPLHMLDVGCGSGILLRTARMSNPHITGIGIDKDIAVVQQARDNIVAWGLSHEVFVLVGDIRQPPADFHRRFDLITMSNNIYYFPYDERVALFRSLRAMLVPGGTLALVSNMQSQGTDVVSANLNMATSSMIGCTPLPQRDNLEQQLFASGFSQVQWTQFLPGNAFYGIMAS